jgi:hypothetical protein
MGRIKHSEQVYINDNSGCEVKLGKIMGLYDESTYFLAAFMHFRSPGEPRKGSRRPQTTCFTGARMEFGNAIALAE